jgi:F420-non-reducing hydrogenase small subunit
MVNALASNGIDVRSIPNRPLLLRFSGAHSLLKPIPHERRSS